MNSVPSAVFPCGQPVSVDFLTLAAPCRSASRLRLLLWVGVTLSLALAELAARAAVITWTNINGGLWNVSSNWSPNTVPGVGDTVFITNAGVYTVTQNVSVTVAGLTLGGDGAQTLTNAGSNLTLNGASAVTATGVLGLAGGTLAGTGVLTVAGQVIWTGGEISSAVNIAANGSLDIIGSGIRYFSGSGVLLNAGVITWSGANDIQTGNSARIINQPGARFDIRNDQLLERSNGGAITNYGIVRKSAANGTTTITVPLVNYGTLDVQSGCVAYGVGAGNQFNDGSAFTGAGTNLVYYGTVAFNGGIASENLELGGATLGGTGTFSGIVNWTSGDLSSGTLAIATNGVLNIKGAAKKNLGGTGTLLNHGLITWSGTNDIEFWSLGRIINQSGAVFDIQNNQSLSLYNGGAITNYGTLRKSAGGGTTTITVPLVNYGTLDVRSGCVAYGANAGNQFNDGSTFTGAGTNLAYYGTVTFNGGIASENLELGGATLGGTGIFSGIVNWTSGDLSGGPLTIATNGVLHIKGPAGKHINSTGTLVNQGLITWSGTNDIETANSARIINQSGAVFDIQNNQSLSLYNGGAITNYGTLRKSAGGGTTTITVPLVNYGTLDVRSGCVAYGANAGNQFNDGSTFTGAGTNLAYYGTVTFNGGIASENLELGGATLGGTGTFSGIVNWTSGDLSGGPLTIATNGVLNIKGPAGKHINSTGTLVNQGLITWSGTNDIETANSARIINQSGAVFDIQNNQLLSLYNGGAITNYGTLRKSGGGGTTTITVPINNFGTVDVQTGTVVLGTYAQVGGELSFGLSGLTNYGRLAFTKNVGFTGTLSVNLNGGYRPVAGDAFALISYPARTGTFAAFNLPVGHAWQTNASIYGATMLTLSVLNSRPGFVVIADQSLAEQTPLNLAIVGNDPDPGQNLTYALLDAPDGATVDFNTGSVTWTPSEAQGPSTNVFTAQITDNGTPVLSATNCFTVVVTEVNLAPTIVVPGPQTMDEMTLLTVSLAATDPDLPANGLCYRLVSAPVGVNLDTNSGALTWTPTESQGPDTNTITVAVADNGVPPLSDTNSFTVIVREVNRAPLLAPLADCTHVPGALRWLTNSASDPDLPADQLTFSLLNAPSGMSIGLTSGLIAWGPPANCPPLTNTVTVRVIDNGVPPLTNEQSFVARLIQIPHLKIARTGPDQAQLSWPAAATAAGFALQSCTNLALPAAWQSVAVAPTVDGDENRLTEGMSTSFRAYRLSAQLMPLPTLRITPAAPDAVEISWPTTTTAAGFVLQTATNLDSEVAWNALAGPIGTNGSVNVFIVPASELNRCFRLRLDLP